jgi:hypothetical protein
MPPALDPGHLKRHSSGSISAVTDHHDEMSIPATSAATFGSPRVRYFLPSGSDLRRRVHCGSEVASSAGRTWASERRRDQCFFGTRLPVSTRAIERVSLLTVLRYSIVLVDDVRDCLYTTEET